VKERGRTSNEGDLELVIFETIVGGFDGAEHSGGEAKARTRRSAIPSDGEKEGDEREKEKTTTTH